MKAPDFFEALALADSSAQQFVSLYPQKGRDSGPRAYYLIQCARGIRWLWRNGDAITRASIATRIAVWRNLGEDHIGLLQARIKAREFQRNGGAR